MNKNSPSSIWAVIASFLTPIVGRVNWSSPPWLVFLCTRAKANPRQFWTVAASLLILLLGLFGGYSWYKSLPQPQQVRAELTAPKSTPLAETLVPEKLIINFGFNTKTQDNQDDEGNFSSQSVAPLQLIGKEVSEGIELSPDLPGQWVWQTDSQLVFMPKQDWPAGQDYTIHFSPEAFAAGTRMESMTYSFATEPFQASIAEFKFYQDPVNAKKRQAVATIRFNFPVDTSSLENYSSLMLQALKKDRLDLDAQPYEFNLSYDEHKRTAYLRSENLSLPEVARYLLLTIGKGVRAQSGTAETRESVSKNLFIPDSANYFKVNATSASIIRNEQDKPEQILAIETTLGIRDAALNKALHVYLLPQNYPATSREAEKKNYEWQNPGEVTSTILALSKPLALQPLPSEANYASLHSYRFNTQTPRYIYLKIDKGARGFGDFALSNDYVAVLKVPEYPKEIGFLHKGALLALSGEKKLSVTLRGLPAVKFEFARVLPDNINQLVTQTQGDFNNPFFINQHFNQQNISEISAEIRQFDASDLTKQQYTALDFSKYLPATTDKAGPQGLFLLQATGWNLVTNQPLDAKASRLILMTDLGLVVKDNRDGSHDVFVQSITQGIPVVNARITVLGKNGLPILTRTTDVQGRANFPILNDFIAEREPTVYLASLDADVSFIPYNKYERQLNYSRYDIGGIYSNQDLQSLSAYLFSDRGIYRPGDRVHLGMIVKQAFAQSQPAGLPLEVTVTDPRGTTIRHEKFSLDASGYLSLDFSTNASSPTGQYLVNLYLVKDNHADSILGSTTVRVAEFLPDRMRISSHLSQEQATGWISPAKLQAQVDLWNLYGAPAVDRKIGAKLLLAPQRVEFAQYPDYRFVDPLLDPKKPAKVFTDTLAETKTDEQGQALFNLNLDRFDKATYQLTFFAEGFEAEGGRSVVTQSTALVSPLEYLVGYKTDGDLAYIKQNDQRTVNFIAVDSQLKQQALDDLRIQLNALRPVVTLVKKPDGTYQYQSIIQTTTLDTKPFTISKEGSIFPLATDKTGDFSLTVLDKDNTELSHLKFSVVGASQQPLARNAELSVKLSKEEYQAGEDIELQITAPYTGSGLITIERDKVYSSQWFKTATTSSMQKIHIPEDFQGNGYVNVTFVRDWESPEIFVSPLSYSLIPFRVNHDNHALQIDLNVPALARPGEPFPIDYKTDKPGKIIVFAVDEGILQVSHYKTPDPLAFFFQKRALEVITQQTVDQILPKYIQDRELSAVGGDGGEEMLTQHLNPFKRKTDQPVVYWSGIVDSDTSTRQLLYPVPDYFNGTLRVMAVAVANDALGSADKKTEIRGNFIINPNTPSFVAPGDEFEITASVANNVKDSGTDAKVSVQLSSTAELEILGSATESIAISEGHEKTLRFRLRAKEMLGAAKLQFTARLGDKSSSIDAGLSLRPASSFSTELTTGSATEASKSLTVNQGFFPDYHKVEAAMSNSPLILLTGLQAYLDNFPYGCTEQLISQTMPLLAMARQPGFANNTTLINDKLMTTLQMLGQRQRSNGGFSYWPGLEDNAANRFASVYAMQFLTEAKAQGYSISDELLNTGLNYLRDLAGQTPANPDQARTQAYAIYLLTRNEIVTTSYLTNLQLYLDKEQAKIWQQDITGAYIAASYQLLQSEAEAQHLIAQYKPQYKPATTMDFHSAAIADAQYLYLLARHFPERLPALGETLILSLVAAANSESINTVLAGYTSLAFGAYAQVAPTTAGAAFSISELLANKPEKTLSTADNVYVKAVIDPTAETIRFKNPKQQRYFYQLIQAGFAKGLATDTLEQGLEIFREYRDSEGNVISSTELGSEIEVHIQVRALDNRYLGNIAIVDLLPGGFEVVTESVNAEMMDYADIREDRVVFFGGIEPRASELVYRIKAINKGVYTVPPIAAASMYNPQIKAKGLAGKMEVT